MKTLKEINHDLAVYNGGPVVLMAGRDAVKHAEALLKTAKYFRDAYYDVMHGEFDGVRGEIWKPSKNDVLHDIDISKAEG